MSGTPSDERPGDGRSDERLVQPRLPSTESDQSRSLPADLLDKAVDRLALLALVATCLVIAEAAISLATDTLHDPVDAASSILLAVASLSLFGAIKIRALDARRLVWLGLGYVVLCAFMISVGDFSDRYWVGGHYLHGLPVVTIWILFVPMVVPTSTVVTAAAGILMSVVGGPVALWAVATTFELPPPDFGNYLEVLLPGLLAAGAALVPARVIHQLGQAVRRARRLGSYQLVERLGAGGMGEVWLAQHALLARPAAVKLIRQDILSRATPAAAERTIRRFEREAQVTANLRSPHTVGLYDFGRTDDGSFYYAMELLSGSSLEELVSEHGPLPEERVVHVLRQVCDSLADAHARDLVHRDVKPANIFVCRWGLHDDFVKVLDFGLVALRPEAEVDPSAPTELSAAGALAGTPSCMAPEAVSTKSRVDARADIYALGCVAYWLLTGHQVFERENAVAVIAAHMYEAPAPPSSVTGVSVSEALEKIVMDCLQKNPEDRPQTAAELDARLAQCTFERPWTRERAHQWWEEHGADGG